MFFLFFFFFFFFFLSLSLFTAFLLPRLAEVAVATSVG